jgi:L-alanine-DL-glutamate epimerase-like enolase superfamily enzyme
MTIRSIKTYHVDASKTLTKSYVFCRVEADDGTVGWGEAYAIPRRERGIAEFVRGLGEMLMTLEDVSPQNFWENVNGWYDEGHLSIDLSCAASAIEVALWDVLGKQAGKPVCDLLGTVVRRSLPLYVNMDPVNDHHQPIERLAKRCAAMKERGFDAVKIYPMEYEPLGEATECVRRVRAAIGEDTHLLLDAWALDDAEFAVEAARSFTPFNPFWFEEPVAGERINEMAEVRRQIELPIVTGERQTGLHHFRAVLEGQAADILNPDIVGVGGILEMVEIARLAETYDAKIAPHCWNSTTVAVAAMAHACAVMPNALIGEYFADYEPFFSQFGELDIDISGGTATIGDAPGLGVRMNEQALAGYEI